MRKLLALLLILSASCWAQQVMPTMGSNWQGAAAIGTFTVVQTGHCSPGSASNTCNITLSQALVAGNLYGWLLYSNSITVPLPLLTSTNAGGTLVKPVSCAVGAEVGPYQPSCGYILPSTSTGTSGTTLTTTMTQNCGSSQCQIYFAELYPSAAPSNVALDGVGALYNAASTSIVGPSFTFSGTGDAVFQGEATSGTGPSSVTSPYNTNAYLAAREGLSVAIPSNGTTPTWTIGSSTPATAIAMAFGWNTTACVENSFQDFEGGVSGNSVTVPLLHASQHGWNGGVWTITGAPKYSSTQAHGLTNATRLCGDGVTYSSGAGTLGLSVTGTGSAVADGLTYSFGISMIPSMTLGFWYYNSLAANDTSLIDCGSITAGAGGQDYSSANCYGDGATRYVVIETNGGGGSHVNMPSVGWYFIEVDYNAGGTHAVKLYDSTHSLIGTSTHAATGTYYPTLFNIGHNNASSITNGAVVYWDSATLSLTGQTPIGW